MIKKLTLLLAALISVCSSNVCAQTQKPDDVDVGIVRVGHLYENNVTYVYDENGNNPVRIQITNCDESWKDNDLFYILKSRSSKFFLIRMERFNTFYIGTGKDWDATINSLDRAGAICSATSF